MIEEWKGAGGDTEVSPVALRSRGESGLQNDCERGSYSGRLQDDEPAPDADRDGFSATRRAQLVED